ncbi:hypothetical protein VA599_11710 [Chromobacterium sp. TRC.1.1.SA]|uniref:Uncharacterized protein n=1 Tax=Chromobacterium indicum TaxID=3110228 RepID=A0ABV0CKJ9_9NEIS
MKILLISLSIYLGLLANSCTAQSVEGVLQGIALPFREFPIATDMYQPFSLLQYTPETGYQVACSASLLLNKSSEEISSMLKESNIPTISLSALQTANVSGNLSSIAGGLGANYQGEYKVEYQFNNGKFVSLDNQYDLQEFVSDIGNNAHCMKTIQLLLQSYPNSQFYQIVNLARYTLSASVSKINDYGVTTSLFGKVSRFIMAQLNVNHQEDFVMQGNGKDLFFGFNGNPITLEQLGYAKNSNAFVQNQPSTSADTDKSKTKESSVTPLTE